MKALQTVKTVVAIAVLTVVSLGAILFHKGLTPESLLIWTPILIVCWRLAGLNKILDE